MKTLDILMIAAGVGIVGYLAYKNKDRFNKPLSDADNEPLRSSFDTGTNNGQGYQTEEEKPAADPVKILEPTLIPTVEVPVKNAVFVASEPVKETTIALPFKQPSSFSSFINNILQTPPPPTTVPIPEYNTTTPYVETQPVLKPLVADVSPSAPVVSITATQEQYPTLLYNNSERNIAQESYDYGLGERDSYNYVQAI